MAFSRAKTALAQIEEKLRRQLGLAGEIGAQFDPHLTPVLIAGDLREPGNAFFTGRHFDVSFNAAGIGSAAYSLQPQQRVLLTQITVSAVAAAANCELYLNGGLGAASALVGTWSERKTGTDQVPILGSTAANPVAANNTNRIFQGQIAAGVTLVIPVNLYLEPDLGNTLNLQSGAALMWLSVHGRIWP